MNCQATQRAIADCPYGSETLALDAVSQAHLSACPACREFAEDRALTNILAHIGHTTVYPLQWERDLLKAASSKPGTSNATVWMYSAAASIFLAVALTALIAFRSPAPDVSSVQLTVDEVKPVKFMLTSSNALQGANITIALSESIELAGFDGARQLNWKTDIKPGNNLLALPVHLLKPVDGKIELQLEHEGSTKTYVITVSPKVDKSVEDESEKTLTI